jgi:hypothetical protein
MKKLFVAFPYTSHIKRMRVCKFNKIYILYHVPICTIGHSERDKLRQRMRNVEKFTENNSLA